MAGNREPLDPRESMWHWLAFQLRYLRESNELTLDQVGALIAAAKSTVSNIEAGRLRIDERQAFRLDQRYGTGFLLQLLLYYARMNHTPAWIEQYTKYEAEARVLKVYSGSTIPGPLQTEGYMRGLLATGVAADDAEKVAARIARQEALLCREDPPWIWVLMDEAAIKNPIGGRQALRDQLKHLLDLTEGPRISVRILSEECGGHPGVSGIFRIISLETREVAYAGAQKGGRLIEEPLEVREFELAFDRIGGVALNQVMSQALIEKRLKEL
ncbi:helix-turn-helix protein [Actinocorallia herbida]|uniref:Helix-turn-helix protein n=1 Tax=Actinocorallia herbida TaxID=58109 RepID=A0A3N1D1G3_9ACTN|nr:helix-turn-helix transcriptional regulator [Actinocorallia herbida]ROO87352.1 helix-turn-helix protein [Actinocorallia herbida]